MHYSSLSTPTHSVPFAEACMRGLAPDGELYLPESIPRFTRSKLRTLQKLDLADLGYEVLSAFITDIPGHDLRSIVSQALNFPIPINPVGTYEVLELSHGPTLSFKDVAARLLARFMAHYAQMAHLPVTVLVATSGDAGGAVASAFSDVPYTRVVVLFPKGRVSKMQYDQMTQVGDGVYPIEVNGSFDQCQSLVKQALVDPHHHHLHLTSANSINIGRLLPQIIYHAYASLQRKHTSAPVVVPSGNLGNVTACLMAKHMGFPIGDIILAVNENDTILNYNNTGTYVPKKSVHTFSNAMDVGDPNNFPRLLRLCGGNHADFRKSLRCVRISDPETEATIKQVHATHGYILDPHTAVAWCAAEKLALQSALIVSTASPAKFATAIQSRLNISVVDHASNDTRATRLTELNPTYTDFSRFLITHL